MTYCWWQGQPGGRRRVRGAPPPRWRRRVCGLVRRVNGVPESRLT
jgi:hypothetical protein